MNSVFMILRNSHLPITLYTFYYFIIHFLFEFWNDKKLQALFTTFIKDQFILIVLYLFSVYYI